MPRRIWEARQGVESEENGKWCNVMRFGQQIKTVYSIVEKFLWLQNHLRKFSPQNFARSAMCMLRVCGCFAHVRGPHLYNNWTGAIRESFLSEIFVLYRNTNVFSLKIFPLYGCVRMPKTLSRIQTPSRIQVQPWAIRVRNHEYM